MSGGDLDRAETQIVHMAVVLAAQADVIAGQARLIAALTDRRVVQRGRRGGVAGGLSAERGGSGVQGADRPDVRGVSEDGGPLG